MLLEQHIDELCLELREAIGPVERREIEIERELARAELAVITAEQEGRTRRPATLLRVAFAMSPGLSRRIDRRFRPEASPRKPSSTRSGQTVDFGR